MPKNYSSKYNSVWPRVAETREKEKIYDIMAGADDKLKNYILDDLSSYLGDFSSINNQDNLVFTDALHDDAVIRAALQSTLDPGEAIHYNKDDKYYLVIFGYHNKENDSKPSFKVITITEQEAEELGTRVYIHKYALRTS